MGTLGVKVESNFESVDRAAQRVKQGFQGEAFRIVDRAAHASIDREFTSQSFSLPGGGTKRWKPRHPLSTKTGPLLGGVGGSYRRSWKTRPTNRFRVVIGSEHPGAAVHRGSTRGGPREKVTRIMPRRFGPTGVPLMWGALFRKGIIMSPTRLARRGVLVPSRPHAGPNPRLRKEINAALARHWVRR